jgi:hypothetical protein
MAAPVPATGMRPDVRRPDGLAKNIDLRRKLSGVLVSRLRHCLIALLFWRFLPW